MDSIMYGTSKRLTIKPGVSYETKFISFSLYILHHTRIVWLIFARLPFIADNCEVKNFAQLEQFLAYLTRHRHLSKFFAKLI